MLTAAAAVLDEVGYGALRLDEVARRAHTSRPALYRRWPGKPALVLAALAERFDVPAAPDTGCTICDLGEALDAFLREFRTVRPADLAALYAECAHEDALREEFMTALFEPTRAAVTTMLERAVRRGDLRADTDLDLVVDLLAALTYYRVLFARSHVSELEVEQAVTTVLRGIAVDYPALVEHSRSLEMNHVVAPD